MVESDLDMDELSEQFGKAGNDAENPPSVATVPSPLGSGVAATQLASTPMEGGQIPPVIPPPIPASPSSSSESEDFSSSDEDEIISNPPNSTSGRMLAHLANGAPALKSQSQRERELDDPTGSTDFYGPDLVKIGFILCYGFDTPLEKGEMLAHASNYFLIGDGPPDCIQPRTNGNITPAPMIRVPIHGRVSHQLWHNIGVGTIYYGPQNRGAMRWAQCQNIQTELLLTLTCTISEYAFRCTHVVFFLVTPTKNITPNAPNVISCHRLRTVLGPFACNPQQNARGHT